MTEPRGGRTRRWLLALYLVLLLVSHGVRAVRPAASDPAPGDSIAQLDVVPPAGSRRIGLVYRDVRPAGRDDAPVVLLIHGSPGDKSNFDGVVAALASGHRLIVPDLPGFGASRDPVPDYSIEAHARYLAALLDHVGVENAHVVGFSLGGGVALELWDRAPERVRSLTLLSATGVQELELLGSYRLNRLIHGLQLGLLWLAHEAVPHMGLFDRGVLSVEYARNFYDTDQRPLRGILRRLDVPTLILHGERDVLVPVAAAREHHRIVPHSTLELTEYGHFMVFRHPDAVAARIAAFVDRVERGEAPTRDAATPERVRAATEPFDPADVPPAAGLTLLILAGLLALGTLVSEDLACVVAGLLAAQGRIGFVAAAAACFVGIYVGDLLLFLAGRYLGRPALRRAPLRWWISPQRVEVSSQWFRRRGPIVILLSRFLPGTRLPTYFGAGLLRTSFWAFSLYFLIAVACWTPVLVGASMLIGVETLQWLELADAYVPLALLLLALALLLIVRLVVPALSHRGRRLLLARWRRWTRWEFWPPWVFYPPVVAWVLWLGVRYRGPTLFTAANPTIEAGGFIAESKSGILRGLADSAAWVARFRLLPSTGGLDERVRIARRFLEQEGLSYPVVLKPDQGQRGSGVIFVRDAAGLREYLARAPFDVMIQEYVAGPEFGIFYYRYPDEPTGRILSVTEKRLPVVVGDGRRTLERLILDDDRTVCMARLHLGRHAEALSRVPEPGERVPVVELGTHCRGAVFLDGGRRITPALLSAVDRISHGFEGFYFGRYDVRASSVEELERGRGFKIVELNGITSEATHIYDPSFGLLEAYRVLFDQWRIAFEIGRRNRDRGVRPADAATLLRLLRSYRRTAALHPG